LGAILERRQRIERLLCKRDFSFSIGARIIKLGELYFVFCIKLYYSGLKGMCVNPEFYQNLISVHVSGFFQKPLVGIEDPSGDACSRTHFLGFSYGRVPSAKRHELGCSA